MKVINEDALRRANDYYDLQDEKLLTVRANEFVQKQRFLTSYLLALCKKVNVDAAAVLMDAAIVCKTFTESGFVVPEISKSFLDNWDKEYTLQLVKTSDKNFDASSEQAESPLSCLIWQPLLVEYFLSFYFGDDFDKKGFTEINMSPGAAQLNLIALLLVEMIHTIVNRESQSDS